MQPCGLLLPILATPNWLCSLLRQPQTCWPALPCLLLVLISSACFPRLCLLARDSAQLHYRLDKGTRPLLPGFISTSPSLLSSRPQVQPSRSSSGLSFPPSTGPPLFSGPKPTTSRRSNRTVTVPAGATLSAVITAVYSIPPAACTFMSVPDSVSASPST